MADFPALPLWTDAYLADTRHLSTLEHGAYLLLMFEAWRRSRCSLPADDTILARLAGVSPEEWAAMKPIIMDFWKLDKRRKEWTQKRLSRERTFLAQKSQSQRNKATKRWRAYTNDDAAALPDVCPADAPTPTPTPIDSKKESNPPSLRSGTPFAPNGAQAPPPKSARQAQGTRLPADWHPGKDGIAYAIGELAPHADIAGSTPVEIVNDEANAFVDYWQQQPGQKGRKLNWNLTWKTWIRTKRNELRKEELRAERYRRRA